MDKLFSEKKVFEAKKGERSVLKRAREEVIGDDDDEDDEEEEEKEEEEKEEDEEDDDDDDDDEEEKDEKKSKSIRKKRLDENEDLEANYMSKLENEEEEEEEEEEENDPKKDSKEAQEAQKSHEVQEIDLKEIELEKADRTVFVGNVVASAMNEKKIGKEFKKFFSQFGKIESLRFRSISFTEQIPKKVAFIQKKFHDYKDSVNVYIVYAEKESVKKAVTKNGELFHDHHLRIDSVSHPFKKDNKRCIFIGNLNFTEVEESLWKHFEGCGKIEYVRIVRDPKTNVGKGFAYVQFEESVSVSKALLQNDKPLKSLSKESKKSRNLRVARCKKSANEKKSLMDVKWLSDNQKLNTKQKTAVGRAHKVLGLKDRKQAGMVIEGARAQEGKGFALKNGKIKKPRVKKARHTERSKKFRKLMDENGVGKKGMKENEVKGKQKN